jgi:hypothetical protein
MWSDTSISNVSEVLAPIALMLEAVNTSETSVKFYRITQHNPQDSHFQRDLPRTSEFFFFLFSRLL